MANGAMQNGQYRAFNAQVDQYLDSTDFRRGVLQKYGVESLVQHPQPRAPGDTPAMPTTPAQAQYQQAQVQQQLAQSQAATALVKLLSRPRFKRSSARSSKPTPMSSTRCRS